MKKLLVGLFFITITNLALGISITEYVKVNGPLVIKKGVIDLSNKGITSLEGVELIEAREDVTRLNLSNNRIADISASNLTIFPNLLVLDLSNNKLTSFPSVSMEKLRELRLDNNRIESLKNLNLPLLKKLGTDNNPLKSVVSLYAPSVKGFNIVKEPAEKVKTVRSVSVGGKENIVIK